jgi:nucleoside-diphosphate-sugar epimerase/CBS domain-containing protein
MQLKDLCVSKTKNLKEVMQLIDQNGYGVAIVTTADKHLLGIVTDSDIRRAILNGVKLETNIEKVMNPNPLTITEHILNKDIFSPEIKDKAPLYGPMQIPVLDKDQKLIDVALITKNGFVGKLLDGKKQSPIKRILVVGGAGYLGSILCEKLLNKGYHVRVLDNLTYGVDGIKPIFYHPNFEFLYGDIRDMQKVVNAIKGIGAVIHLAAIVGDPASALKPSETIESNYLASKMLAEVCKYSQINRFIFASTCSVYGAAEPGKLLTETSELNPVSLYAEMKLKSEQGILELGDENFAPTILRKGTLYGKSHRMRFDLVINTLTIKALKENQFKIFGGNQYRALCHVSDAADAYIKCLEAPIEKVKSEIFNVVTDNLKVIKIGDIVHKSIPKSKMIIEKDNIDTRNYCVDSSKIEKALDFKSKYDIIDGIDEIKDAVLKEKKYSDYINPKYSNVEYLRDKK